MHYIHIYIFQRMDLQEVGCGHVDWIGLAQDRDRWRTLVSAVMNLRVPWNAGNFLTSCKPVSCSGRTLHCGVSKFHKIKEIIFQAARFITDVKDEVRHLRRFKLPEQCQNLKLYFSKAVCGLLNEFQKYIRRFSQEVRKLLVRRTHNSASEYEPTLLSANLTFDRHSWSYTILNTCFVAQIRAHHVAKSFQKHTNLAEALNRSS